MMWTFLERYKGLSPPGTDLAGDSLTNYITGRFHNFSHCRLKTQNQSAFSWLASFLHGGKDC